MVLLHPEYLWGLGAIIIPIIIHLFDFRKNKKVYFPDISFLKQVQHASKKPLRVKQLLILFSRIGFITFLVVAFTQPVLPTDEEKALNKGVKLVYIDNSQSMNAQLVSKESALEKAKSVAQTIIKKFPKEERIIVVNNANMGKFSIPYTANESSSKIAEITYAEKPFSLSNLTMVIANLNQHATKVSDVFIISDFQKSTVTKMKDDTLQSIWVSALKTNQEDNCVVDSVYFLPAKLTGGEKRSIEVAIKNYGSSSKKNLLVKVFLGDRQVSAATITLPAYQIKRLSFSLGTISKAQSGYIQIEDYPNTFDNVFYFSIQKKKQISVLEIIGENPSPYVQPVFGNDEVFSFASINHQNIDLSLFNKTDFIILNQIIHPSVELVNQLKRFAKEGGAVLVIPSIEGSIAAYQNFSNLLVTDLFFQQKKLTVPSIDAPFFKEFFEKPSGKFMMPEATPVWGWGQDHSALLSFEDGSPFLSELAKNIYFLSAPLLDSVSTFQTNALFVPVMYNLASNKFSSNSQLFYRINDDRIVVELDSIQLKDVIKLVKGGVEIIPAKTKIGTRWKLEMPRNILTTGNYQIMLGEKSLGWLAINSMREESQLNSLNKTEIEGLFSSTKVRFLDFYDYKENILISFDAGKSLWKFALTICLLFLLVETLLIRFL